MELIQPETNDVGPLSEPEPRYQPANSAVAKTEHGQTWIRTVVMIFIAIVLIVLIVLFARWVYHKTHHKSPVTAPTSQSTPAQSSNPSQAPGASPSPSAGATTPTPSPAASGSNLANTGPGNVVGIFIVSSVAAASLHYIVSVRRLAKNQV